MDITTERLLLRTPQCDLSGHLSLGEFFLLSQEIAGVDSEKLGFGQTFIDREGVFWVLSRVSAQIHRPPKRFETVYLKTWHGDTVRYIYPRYYRLEDEAGGVLAEVSSLWMLVDRAERSIVMPSMRGFPVIPARDDMPKYPSPGKLRFGFPPDQSATRAPLYSDFDINGHMNNARYPVWILDLFPPARFRESFVRSIQINYVQEILEGDDVLLSFGERDGAFGVRGTVGDSVKFEAVGEFAPLLMR